MEGRNPDFAGVQSRKDQTIKKTVIAQIAATASPIQYGFQVYLVYVRLENINTAG